MFMGRWLKTVLGFAAIFLITISVFVLFPTNRDNVVVRNSPSPIQSVSVPTVSPQKLTYPSEIIDLTNWKITLPTGNEERAREVKQPELAKFFLAPWFEAVLLPSGLGVRFRAPVNGVTTSGSGYPRSELREMTNNGLSKARWSSSTGPHILRVEEAITAVPKTKKHVVAGQIHDADQDILVIRLEYPKLLVNVDGKNVSTLDSNYVLGRRFVIRLEVVRGRTNVYYNNAVQPAYTLVSDYSDAYFKVGAYTQSNCNREKSSLCNDDNFGEVVVYQVSVTHPS